MNISKRDIVLMVLSLAICLVAGFIGSLAINDTTLFWYATLNKSALNPPSWVFAPVWSILYILMGVALFMIIKSRKHKLFTLAISLFAVQIILNVIWSHMFFASYSPKNAFYEIMVLDIVVVALLYFSSKISNIISYVLMPYAIWILFASYLNWYVVNNNLIFSL